jgi:exodeoxyribonuclease VII large subunit
LRGLERRRAEFRALARALPQSDSIFALRRQQLDHLESRLIAARSKAYHGWHLRLTRLAHRLAQQSPHARLAGWKHRFETLKQRLERWAANGGDGRKQALAHLTARLTIALAARARLESERTEARRRRLQDFEQRMTNAFAAVIEARRQLISNIAKILASLDYRQVLARGYALVRDEHKRLLRRAAEVADGTHLDIEFADGHKTAVADGPGKATPAKRPPRPGRRNGEQGSLL